MRGKQPTLILINLLLSFMVMAQERTDTLRGCYAISYGYSGRKMEFEPNGRFLIKDYACVGSTVVDSGVWKANGDNSYFIQSSRFKNTFHIIRYDQYLFLISDAERSLFTKDLAALDKEYAGGVNYGSKEWPATKSQMIYSTLTQKYFVRRLNGH